MKKAVYIVVAALVMAWAPAPQVWAEDENQQLELEPVVVTADRWGVKEGQETDRVTSITKKEILNLPARDAGEALDYMPGVVMGRGGAGGVNSPVFPSVQGAEYYQTPVYINGIPFSDLSSGLGNIGQIPAELIDRIEVIHGAGGMEWGAAQGGLINIILNAPNQGRKNSLLVGGGEHGTVYSALDVQHWTENFGVVVGGGYRTSHGPEEHTTEVDNTSGTLGVKALLGDSMKLDATAYTFRGKTGSGEYRGDLAGYYEIYDYNTTGGGATLEVDLGAADLRLNVYTQTYEGITDQYMLVDGKVGESNWKDNIMGGSAIVHSELGFATLVAGADSKNGKLESSDLTEDSYTIDQYGVFANLTREMGPLVIQGGGRWSSEDYFGNFTAFNLGVRYALDAAPVDIKLSAARGYTNPPLSFRFLEIPDIWAANPDLVVEKVMTYQVGVVVRPAKGLTLDINGFFANLEDAIGADVREDGLYHYRNFQKVERSGVEAEISYQIHGWNLFANTLSQTVKDKDTGDTIHGKPKAAHSFGAGYKWGHLYTQVSGLWRDWNEFPDNQPKDKVWILGLKALYELHLGGKEVGITLTVNNLTDAEYYNHHMLPESHPRDIEAGIEYAF
ncbi:MAG: TonB-dependent receptor plug domain-containing protein [Nitrospinota bacterium]|nr:TonB-dependent receptor plug domain-containing protein [Nitrospinota bacterium]